MRKPLHGRARRLRASPPGQSCRARDGACHYVLGFARLVRARSPRARECARFAPLVVAAPTLVGWTTRWTECFTHPVQGVATRHTGLRDRYWSRADHPRERQQPTRPRCARGDHLRRLVQRRCEAYIAHVNVRVCVETRELCSLQCCNLSKLRLR